MTAEGKTTELGEMLLHLADAGLKEEVGSWVGAGTDNEPVTSAQLREALPDGVLEAAAAEAGMSVEELADQLARELPAATDTLTPGGELADDAQADRLARDLG
ncbi:YidB family protein [Actinomadura gamaensis]|uniref:YidB family protein n=1 Tax=Actinomadura gamaensis TaxID=1763541 RepID=A0ABV9UAN2_9ACTN